LAKTTIFFVENSREGTTKGLPPHPPAIPLTVELLVSFIPHDVIVKTKLTKIINLIILTSAMIENDNSKNSRKPVIIKLLIFAIYFFYIN